MNPMPLRLAALVLLSGLCASSPVMAQRLKAVDVVKATAVADKPDADGKQTVTITLAISKPWHLYANPVENKGLEDPQTAITVSSAVKPTRVDISYPAGKLEKDEIVGDYKIYEGTVIIKATVVRAKGDTGPLTIATKVSACRFEEKGVDGGACLEPGTIKIEVK